MGKILSAAKYVFKILVHKACVGYFCFKAGLYWRGIVHDLSKFHPAELMESIRYYSPDRSPIILAKKENGWSSAWLHHKGMNRHHYEYWVDDIDHGGKLIRMPFNDALELVCDGLGASIAYNWKVKGLYQNEWKWWIECCLKKARMHPQTRMFIHMMLRTMKEENSSRILDRRLAEWTYNEAASRCRDFPAACPIEQCKWQEPEDFLDKAFWEC